MSAKLAAQTASTEVWNEITFIGNCRAHIRVASPRGLSDRDAFMARTAPRPAVSSCGEANCPRAPRRFPRLSGIFCGTRESGQRPARRLVQRAAGQIAASAAKKRVSVDFDRHPNSPSEMSPRSISSARRQCHRSTKICGISARLPIALGGRRALEEPNAATRVPLALFGRFARAAKAHRRLWPDLCLPFRQQPEANRRCRISFRASATGRQSCPACVTSCGSPKVSIEVLHGFVIFKHETAFSKKYRCAGL